MNNIIKLIISILLFSFCCGCLEGNSKKVCVNNTCILAEVAQTESARERGLMFRNNLDRDKGMLFIFENETYQSFWMKNMQISLDIIWVNNDKIIVDITKRALPCKESCLPIGLEFPVKYVLEVNAGFTDQNKIKVGDKLKF